VLVDGHDVRDVRLQSLRDQTHRISRARYEAEERK